MKIIVKVLKALGVLIGLGVIITLVGGSSSGALLFSYGPRSASLVVKLDGKVARKVQMGGFAKVPLKKGDHQVVVESDGGANAQRLSVKSGSERYFVPAKNQCYVLLDISHLYAAEGEQAIDAPPGVKLRVTGDEAVTLPPNVVFGAIPSRLDRESAHLMLEAPCPTVRASDDELLRALGPELKQMYLKALKRSARQAS